MQTQGVPGLGSVVSLALILLAVYLVIAAAVLLWGERLMFFPPPAGYRADEEGLRLVETADGAQIPVLHLPNDSADLLILFSHGNAEDLGVVRPLLDRLRGLGFRVLAYDYRGYGIADGRPTEAGAYRDVEAAYAHAVRELGVPPERIILHGRSIGSGPTLELAVREPVGGVIIESGFTTAHRVVTRIPLFPFDRFRNIDRVRRLQVPVLVIHGTRDEVVPFSHGRRLFEAAPEPKRRLWVEGAGHNDVDFVAGEAYDRAVREFAEMVLAGEREE